MFKPNSTRLFVGGPFKGQVIKVLYADEKVVIIEGHLTAVGADAFEPAAGAEVARLVRRKSGIREIWSYNYSEANIIKFNYLDAKYVKKNTVANTALAEAIHG
jgi:hypothetical protein